MTKRTGGSLREDLASTESRAEDVAERMSLLEQYRILLAGPYPALARACKMSPEFASLDPVKANNEFAALAAERLALESKRASLTAEIKRQEEATRAANWTAAVKEHRAVMREAAEHAIKMAKAIRRAKAIRESVGHSSCTGYDPLEAVGLPGTQLAGFDVNEPTANINIMVREMVRVGYIDGTEPFLQGVAWRQ